MLEFSSLINVFGLPHNFEGDYDFMQENELGLGSMMAQLQLYAHARTQLYDSVYILIYGIIIKISNS